MHGIGILCGSEYDQGVSCQPDFNRKCFGGCFEVYKGYIFYVIGIFNIDTGKEDWIWWKCIRIFGLLFTPKAKPDESLKHVID